jgi:pimeloyl-ACP methyl ester carboxylesterase
MALATLSREGRGDLVLFLHGLGCAKENFAGLWDAPELSGAALLAPDLPGHGSSQGLPPETWSMEGMTAAVGGLLRDREVETLRLHVVVHSMGSAIGLLLAEQTELPLASFINVEGNLVGADCGMLSRRTADIDLEHFRDGKFTRLKARAREADDPIVREWAGWMDACPAEALHASARSLVAWSDSGRLLRLFHGLSVPTAYVYGEHSANPDVLAHLETVPKYPIAESGHFVMIDKPTELAAVIGTVMAQAGR